MNLETLPPNARAIIEATATEYGVEPDAMFAPWPRPADAEAARNRAMIRLRNETIDRKPRFKINDLSKWFGVSRPRINRHCERQDEYSPRLMRRAR